MTFLNDDTIVAVATPPGVGAIGVVRLSGPASLSLLQKVWKGKTQPQDFTPRQVYWGEIQDLQGHLCDQVLVFWMKAPASYTGDDVLEIQGHGNPHLLEKIVEILVQAGARMAGPGEFTQRAFLNGRMDLAQAEAVSDVISGASTKAIGLAMNQLQGKLSEYVSLLRRELTVMRAQMEAIIDFPEDEDVQQTLYHQEIQERVNIIIQRIQKLTATYQEGRLLREGIRVAIVGKPNVGKSSLFNALLQEDRAIVHATPGTTRDLIEETLNLNGLQVRFIDTAGLRRGDDVIEEEGIRRSRERLQQADLILAVFDQSSAFEKEDISVLELLNDKPVFYLRNKSDLPSKLDTKNLPPSPFVFSLSAKNGIGISELKQAITSHFVKTPTSGDGNEIILTNLRHKTSLEKGLNVLHGLIEACREKRSLEMLVVDLTLAMNALGEVTGEVTHDEILGEIFSKFCIGK